MLEYKGERLTGVVAKDREVLLFQLRPLEEDCDEITKSGTLIRINDALYKIKGHEWFKNNFGQQGVNIILAVMPIPEKTPRLPDKKGRMLDL